MFTPKLLMGLACLAPATNGLYFLLDPFTATDILLPSQSHSIEFTVCNAAAVSEQGGNGSANCSISWTTPEPPACWSECSGGTGFYYAKVTPGTYKSAGEFSLDVWQAYVYELGNHNNATVPISATSNTTSYLCSHGAQSTVCTLEGDSRVFNQTLQQFYGGEDPVGAPIC